MGQEVPRYHQNHSLTLQVAYNSIIRPKLTFDRQIFQVINPDELQNLHFTRKKIRVSSIQGETAPDQVCLVAQTGNLVGNVQVKKVQIFAMCKKARRNMLGCTVYTALCTTETTLKLKASLFLCLLYLLFSFCRAFEATHLVQDREAWREGVPVRGLRHRAGPGEL